MDNPKISILVPSYNHEKFLLDALESILMQNINDFEVIILDDASKDRSPDIIRQFITDHSNIKIEFHSHTENQGGVRTLNHLIELAKGQYIALLNSDDIWHPDKLPQQIEYLDEHPETAAVFTQAQIVDEEKIRLTADLFPEAEVFIQKNRSRGAWMERFFFQQNCLCHPSVVIRKSVYDQIGLYDPRLRQIPDLQMWTRFIKKFEFYIIEKPLVSLRWHRANTSVINQANSIRGLNELFYLYRDIFEGVPAEVIIDGFSKYFRNPDARQPLELECEKAFLYFIPSTYIKAIYQNIGLMKLFQLLGDPTTTEILREKYKFSEDGFQQLGGSGLFDGSLIQSIESLEKVDNSRASAEPTIGAEYIQETAPIYGLLGLKVRLVNTLARHPTVFNLTRKIWYSVRGKSLIMK